MLYRLVFFLSFIFLFSCDHQEKKTIILSKASTNYINWLVDDNINIINAYESNNLDSILLIADGIVLTGGEDINPLMYGDSSNLQLCEKMDFRRDTIEKKLFDFSLKNNIPFIGICRGMQMMNVAHGGTLYGDIPSEIDYGVIHRNNGEVMHEIVVSCSNILYANMVFPYSLRDTIFTVNSWHHQGLKIIPNHLRVIARAFDGLPEAVVMDKSVHPFMIAVQFHPERLGQDNLIHQTMKSSFYKQIRK